MPVNINGTTGVESPGYTQGGDPIVESGSNSDGEWTRWADGTQVCATIPPISQTIDVSSAIGSIYRSTVNQTIARWNFPALFNEADSAVTGSIAGGGDATIFGIRFYSVGADYAAGIVYSSNSRTAESVSFRAIATGRWK